MLKVWGCFNSSKVSSTFIFYTGDLGGVTCFESMKSQQILNLFETVNNRNDGFSPLSLRTRAAINSPACALRQRDDTLARYGGKNTALTTVLPCNEPSVWWDTDEVQAQASWTDSPFHHTVSNRVAGYLCQSVLQSVMLSSKPPDRTPARQDLCRSLLGDWFCAWLRPPLCTVSYLTGICKMKFDPTEAFKIAT